MRFPDVLRLCRQALQEAVGHLGTERVDGLGQAPTARPAHAVEGNAEEKPSEEAEVSAEFGDLLAELGAAPGGDDGFDLRDTTIRELQGQLANLQSLGDRLAAAERARIAAETELERVRAATQGSKLPRTQAPVDAELRAENTRLRRKLARRDARVEALEEKITRLRCKVEERHRVAAERWHELRRLKGERRKLSQALDAAQSHAGEPSVVPAALATEVREPERPAPSGMSLAELMRPDVPGGLTPET